jgi:two-component system, sensor histidine kinase and response regulator
MNGKEAHPQVVKPAGDAAQSRQGADEAARAVKLGASPRSNSVTPPFDLQESLVRLGGSQELFRSLVEFFLEDCPGLLKQLHSGLDRGDAAQVERAGHSIKGLAANFGAAEAVRAAAKVEDLGRNGDLTASLKALPVLETELERLQTALSDYLQTLNT